jgi:hypothetical protein
LGGLVAGLPFKWIIVLICLNALLNILGYMDYNFDHSLVIMCSPGPTKGLFHLSIACSTLEKCTKYVRGICFLLKDLKKQKMNKFGVKPGPKSGTPAVRAGTQGKNPDTSNKGRDQKYPKHRNSNSGVATVQQSSSGPKRFESLFWMPLVNNLLKKSLVPVCEIIAFVISPSYNYKFCQFFLLFHHLH